MPALVNRRAVAALLCAIGVLEAPAQTARRSKLDPAKLARVTGTVVSEATGEPLNRVRIFLKSISGEAPNLAVEADEHGRFTLASVVPGKYTITAQRDGYLTGAAAMQNGSRLPEVLYVEPGSTTRDLTFRLRPWSVISGRVRFSDAEPAIGVLVQVFRDVYSKGRRTFAMTATTRTNDRGEYRLAGLRAGSYYVAASYDRPLSPEFAEQDPVDESGRPLPQMRYSTTFFPSAQKLAEAMHVRVGAMQEAPGIDIFLEPVQTVQVRGRTLSGLTGQPLKIPNLRLRRLSSDERSSINAPITVMPRGDGFEIRGVAAGPYVLVADAIEDGVRLFARKPLIVTDAPIEDLEVLLAPERRWRGTVEIDGAPTLPVDSLRLTLEPRSDLNPAVPVKVDSSGGFTANVVPEEVYDAYLTTAPDDLFIRSVRVANMEVDADGISGQQASSSTPLRITVSAAGGVLLGRVFGAEGKIAPGTNIAVVPDPVHGRAHRYRIGYADAYGLFQIRGLSKGRYTAFAYYDEPPCELYDPDAVDTCRSLGANVSISEATQAVTSLRVAQPAAP